jgi:uncharacterized protein (DUF2267 family)
MNFEKWVANANAFVNEVGRALGDQSDTERARRIVRSVLHTLRARLSIDESMHLLAQLPMLLKAIYVDGWKLSSSGNRGIHSEDDFLFEMLQTDGHAGHRDFPDRQDARKAAVAVLGVISRHVASGEMDALEHSMPRPIRHLIEDARRAP